MTKSTDLLPTVDFDAAADLRKAADAIDAAAGAVAVAAAKLTKPRKPRVKKPKPAALPPAEAEAARASR